MNVSYTSPLFLVQQLSMVVGGVVQCDSQNTEKTHSLTRFLGNLGCICVWVELGSGLLMRWTLPPLARSGNSSSS